MRRDAVRARVRPEVRVERAVFLHDNDHVLDLVDAGLERRGRRARPYGQKKRGTGRQQDRD
jgi:hypothetical protein